MGILGRLAGRRGGAAPGPLREATPDLVGESARRRDQGTAAILAQAAARVSHWDWPEPYGPDPVVFGPGPR